MKYEHIINTRLIIIVTEFSYVRITILNYLCIYLIQCYNNIKTYFLLRLYNFTEFTVYIDFKDICYLNYIPLKSFFTISD